VAEAREGAVDANGLSFVSRSREVLSSYLSLEGDSGELPFAVRSQVEGDREVAPFRAPMQRDEGGVLGCEAFPRDGDIGRNHRWHRHFEHCPLDLLFVVRVLHSSPEVTSEHDAWHTHRGEAVEGGGGRGWGLCCGCRRYSGSFRSGGCGGFRSGGCIRGRCGGGGFIRGGGGFIRRGGDHFLREAGPNNEH